MKMFEASQAVVDIVTGLKDKTNTATGETIILIALLDLVRAAEIISAQLEQIYMAIPEGPDDVERWEKAKEE